MLDVPFRAWRHLALLLCTVVTAAAADDFTTANEHYDAGRFVEAKQLYERLLESGTRSANLFHNLANTDYRIGAPGRAMLGYERALALDPRHAEARANLKMLRAQAHARDLERSLLERSLVGVSERAWTLAAALAAWAAVLCLVFIATTSRRGHFGLWFGVLGGLAVAALAGFALARHAQDRTLAIVTAKEAEAHLAPAESAARAGFLPAGSRVRVLSERGPWIYCDLPDDRRGWVAADTIERVRPEGS